MPVVPLDAGFTNVAEFVDSLFDADVRTPGVLRRAIRAGDLTVGFSGEGDRIVAVWLAAWRRSQGDPYDPASFGHCPAGDRPFLAFLAGYLKSNTLSMFVPRLAPAGTSPGGLPVYALGGYDRSDFVAGGAWSYAAVEAFLRLLLHGAHFVAIHDPVDLPHGPPVSPLWAAFRAKLPGLRHDFLFPAIGSSHYTRVSNLCGWYHPSVTEERAPRPCPFVLSLLVGPTVPEVRCRPRSYASFMQLEGWELPDSVLRLPGSRHHRDYGMHDDTLWNLSTYGACAYSEKRATAVFLAPAAWAPRPTPGTFMPPYVGARTPQKWLQTDLVTLPSR